MTAFVGFGCALPVPGQRTDPQAPAGTLGAPDSALERRCQSGDGSACGKLGAAFIARSNGEGRDFERGVVLLEVACGDDDMNACTTLGTLYGHNRGPTVRARARDLLDRACKRAAAAACTGLGAILLADEPRDPREAAIALERACELGDGRGCELRGEAALHDELGGDTVLAQRMFATACRLNRLSSCHRVALAVAEDELRRDEGMSLLKANCGRGFALSCAALAAPLAPLIGARRDCPAALPWAEQACAKGEPNGCAIGEVCRLGASPTDQELDGLRVACGRRVPLACLYWADARDRGEASARDTSAQRRAYRIACDSRIPGTELACGRVAVIALAEAKTTLDADEPLAQLRQACSRASGEACCNLAGYYQSGKWLAVDSARAAELRARACQLGEQRCCPSQP